MIQQLLATTIKAMLCFCLLEFAAVLVLCESWVLSITGYITHNMNTLEKDCNQTGAVIAKYCLLDKCSDSLCINSTVNSIVSVLQQKVKAQLLNLTILFVMQIDLLIITVFSLSSIRKVCISVLQLSHCR